MRQRADLIRLDELDRVMPKLPRLTPDERDVVEQFSARLVNKLLHAPTLRLREAATSGQSESEAVEALVRTIFDLQDDPDSDQSDTIFEAD